MQHIRGELQVFFLALGFFSRLPVPSWVAYSEQAQAQALRYFPWVGVLVAGLGSGLYLLATVVWPPVVALLLTLVAMVYLTGGLHEDGLADTVDALGGSADRARALAIMKDSRIGSYGVMALVGSLTLKAVLLLEILPYFSLPAVLVFGQVLSRCMSASVVNVLPYARTASDGTDSASKSKGVIHPLSAPSWLVSLMLVLGLGIGLFPLPVFVVACIAAIGVTYLLVRWFQVRLQGFTGDCLGAVQQLSELALYLGMLAVAQAGRS